MTDGLRDRRRGGRCGSPPSLPAAAAAALVALALTAVAATAVPRLALLSPPATVLFALGGAGLFAARGRVLGDEATDPATLAMLLLAVVAVAPASGWLGAVAAVVASAPAVVAVRRAGRNRWLSLGLGIALLGVLGGEVTAPSAVGAGWQLVGMLAAAVAGAAELAAAYAQHIRGPCPRRQASHHFRAGGAGGTADGKGEHETRSALSALDAAVVALGCGPDGSDADGAAAAITAEIARLRRLLAAPEEQVRTGASGLAAGARVG